MEIKRDARLEGYKKLAGRRKRKAPRQKPARLAKARARIYFRSYNYKKFFSGKVTRTPLEKTRPVAMLSWKGIAPPSESL